MTQNINLQHSESNQVILINTEEETQVVSGMTLTSEPLSLKTPLRVNELAYVIRIISATLSVQIVSLPASI